MVRLALVVSAGVAAICWVKPASAVTYQVGPSKQYQTLDEVADLLGPGDVVEIDGDATYAGGVIFQQPGTAASKITIRGIRINGQRPVIQGATNTIEVQGDHYVFEGLDLTGGSFRCFYHHAHDVILRDSVIHDCAQHGLLGADSDSGSLLMEYVEVYGCGGGTQDHQIYMATDESAHPGAIFRMQHCWVHDANGGNNVKSRAERNEIFYNWIQGAQYHELELIGPDGQDPNLAREDSDVVGNVLVKDATSFVARFGGDGTGETGGRYRFVNNTVVVQPGGSAVFRLFDSLQSVEMHNNVFLVQGSGSVNLVRQVEAAWTNGEQIAGSNNWVQNGAQNTPSTWTGTLTGDDPGFVDFATLDVHPASGSPLIDAGSASLSGPPGYDFPSPTFPPGFEPPLHTVLMSGATQRAANGAVDIGAYEFGPPATGGTGGSGGTGAAPGTGATSSGGTGTGGASNGGTGQGGSGTGGGSSGSGGSNAKNDSGDDGGCGCRTAPTSTSALWLLGLAALGLWRRKR
jgi:MYXO-CTERM domain-containing protein